MSTGSRGVFLCPACESVATGQGDGTAVCQSCHLSFELPKAVQETNVLPAKVDEVESASSNLIQRDIGQVEDSPETKYREEKIDQPLQARPSGELAIPHRPHRQKRKRPIKKKKNYSLIFLLWLLTVAVITSAALWLSGLWSEKEEAIQSAVSKLTGENREFYQQEYPGIEKQFQSFAYATSNGPREDLVRRVPSIGRKMEKFYRESSSPIPSGRLAQEPSFWNVAHQESPGFVETAWRKGEQAELEAVFVKESNEWRLDWEQFVRYNSQNWALFRQNLAPASSGTFRLYLEKLDEGKVSENSWIKVRLYEPVRDPAHRLATASRVLKLESSDPVTIQVAQAFVDREGESEGYSKLWKRDPQSLRRVIVELEWKTDTSTGEEVLVLRNILAHHWRTLDVRK